MSITASPDGLLQPDPDKPGSGRHGHEETTEKVRRSPAGRAWFLPVTIAALVILAGVNVVLFNELGNTRKQLELQLTELKERNATLDRRLAATDERHASLQGEVMMTREKLGVTQRDLNRAASLAKQLSEEQKEAEAQIGQVGYAVNTLREEAGAKLAAVNTEVSTAKTDIATTRKDLEQTRVQLTSAIGDISKANTLIARNRDELGELRRRGERNYFEFDLPKEKQPRRIGDVAMKLKKADPKRQRYTIEVVAQDVKTEKKDKTVNEPVQFYMGSSRTLYEVVVNQVSKDRITGYLATPK